MQRGVLFDPVDESPPGLRWDPHRSQADNHAVTSSRSSGIPASGRPRSVIAVGGGTRRNHDHSVRSYADLIAPASTNGNPSASCTAAPATTGPNGRVT